MLKQMKRTLCAAVALGLATTVGVAAAQEGQGLTLDKPAKIAMLYISPRNDGGWTQAFDEARQKLESELDTKIQYVESVPENASSIRPAVDRLIQRGANVIIGTAFGYSDTFKELADKYPQVAFLNGSGTTNGANLESFYGRTYESQYLCGMAAGAASKTGKLGFVAANPFGQVNWTINAFALGARRSTGRRHRGLHRRLERPGQGTRRGHGADRLWRRRTRPARRQPDAADRRPGARCARHRPPPRHARVRS